MQSCSESLGSPACLIVKRKGEGEDSEKGGNTLQKVMTESDSNSGGGV